MLTQQELTDLGAIPLVGLLTAFGIAAALILRYENRRQAKAKERWLEERRQYFSMAAAAASGAALVGAAEADSTHETQVQAQGEPWGRFEDASTATDIHWLEHGYTSEPWSHAGAIGPAGPDNDWGMSAGVGFGAHHDD